jgi:hypothetical protein
MAEGAPAHTKFLALTRNPTFFDVDSFYLLKNCFPQALGCEGQHEFHSTCARKWLERHRTCPLCRADVAEAQMANQAGQVSQRDNQTFSSQATARDKSRGKHREESETTWKSHRLLEALLRENQSK